MNPWRTAAAALAVVIGLVVVILVVVAVVCYAVVRLGVILAELADRRAEAVATASDALPASATAGLSGGGPPPSAAARHPRHLHPRCRRG